MDLMWLTILNNALLAFIALCTAVGAFLSYRANSNTAATRQAMEKQGETITMLEVNTNSMKDALVKATEIGALATGRADGIREERANPQISSVNFPEPAPPPVTPLANPQVIIKEEGKKTVTAMNVRIIPDPVEPLPVKETK